VTQPISATALPLPTGAATETSNAAIRDRLPVALGATIAANSLPVTLSTDGAFSTSFGAIADSAATTDTGSFSHLALFKRLLQRFTSLLAALPSALTASGNFKVAIAESTATNTVTGSVSVNNLPTTQAISAAALPLPTGAALDASSVAIRDRLPSALTASGNFKVAISESITRTPTYTRTLTTGTIAAGAQSIAIANIGVSEGTVLGVILPAGASISWSVNAMDTLSAVSYNATSTTFLITTT
jgi:hypothetical protein